MKTLVTGANGFIGSTLIKKLNHFGFEVFALLRKSSDTKNLEGLKYTRCEGSLNDINSLNKAVQGMDYIFHLAGVTSAASSNDYFEHNAYGTARLAQATSKYCKNIKNFIYVSSLAAGGPAYSLVPRTELDKDDPVSLYGISKLKGEQELLKYEKIFPLGIIRPPMVYGPKDKGLFFMIKTVSKNWIPILPGTSKEKKKYYSSIHSEDLSTGLIQAATSQQKKPISNRIFYLSEDKINSYEEIMTLIAKKLGKKPFRIKISKFTLQTTAFFLGIIGGLTKKNFPLNQDKIHEILPNYWICANQKAKDTFGFNPQFKLDLDLITTIEWYQKNKWL